MGLGLMVPIAEASHFGGTPRFADMLEMTRIAADVGFDIAWFADHLAFELPPETEVRGVWDCWTVMGGLAAATERIGIGTLVACTGFRNPGVIAKMAEAIDEISGGRFVLGLGAGWHEPEYEMFGFPFDHRVGRFEEAIGIIAPMLREGRADLAGRFFSQRGRSTSRAARAPVGCRSWSARPGRGCCA
jgi:alkanesulfonate monooxygenase SsuD/methylene tetrahydromethanopterin reductase-like flavin-dependent oxidoreductase (luciferase family)